MTKKKPLKLPVAKLLPPAAFFKVDDVALETRKVNEIVDLLWLPDWLSDEEKNARILRALQLFEDIKPEGGLEGMLAMQMIGTHSAAMECLRRATIKDQSFEGPEHEFEPCAKTHVALYTTGHRAE